MTCRSRCRKTTEVAADETRYSARSVAWVELDAAARAAGQGDRAALTSVLEDVREPIERYVRGRIGVGERHLFSADDIAQE